MDGIWAVIIIENISSDIIALIEHREHEIFTKIFIVLLQCNI